MKNHTILIHRLLPILLLGLFGGGCHALEHGETVLETANVVGVPLQLINSNGVCTLLHKQNGVTTRLALVPQPPCFFLRTGTAGQTTPQHFAYPKAGVKAALIVAGTLIGEERRKKHGIAADHLCGSVMQGVLLLGNRVSVSADVFAGGIACRDSGRDEKDYWHFAHTKGQKN